MGTAHAICINEGNIDGMVLTAVCDIDKQRLDFFNRSYPVLKTYENYIDLLHSNEIDAVIIAVPHPLHSEIAVEAFKCGLHVVLEKPADISISRVELLNQIAADSGKKFAIMFNQRTNPLFKKVREIVQSGQLGELKRTIWIITNWYRTQSYYDSGSWRATWSGEGGGVLINQAPHNLDLWQWICGMPESVTAYCDVAKYHNIEVEDDVTVFTRYKNGAVGTFITSTGEYPGTNRLEISGSLGKVVVENATLKWWRLRTDEREVCRTDTESFAKIETEYTETVSQEPESGHKGILQNFANAVLFGEELLSPGFEGIFELTLSNAAYLSSWKGNCEIKLPFDTAEFDEFLHRLAQNTEGRSGSTSSNTTGYHDRWRVQW